MSSSGPSASEVAAEVRRKNLENRLRVEDPDRHEEYLSTYWTENVISGAAVLVLLGGGFLLSAATEFENFAPFVVGIVTSALVGFFLKHFSKANQILTDFETKIIARENTAQQQVSEVKIMSEKAFQSRGINVVAHPNSTVLIGSKVINSFNSIEKSDPELAQAIATLVGFVDKQNNLNAADALEDLVTEIDGEKKASRIRASWDYLVKLLPDVAKLSAAAAVISKLF